jgi:hypothetical protein
VKALLKELFETFKFTCTLMGICVFGFLFAVIVVGVVMHLLGKPGW